MSRCSSHRQCLDQACSTSPLSRISSKSCRGHRETIERFCCFYSGPQTIPFIGVGAFRFFVRSLCTPLSPRLLLAWKFTILCLYSRNTRHLVMPNFFGDLVRAHESVSTTKIQQKFTPKYPFPAGLHNSERLQHIVPASFRTTAARAHLFLLILEGSWVNTGELAGAGAI